MQETSKKIHSYIKNIEPYLSLSTFFAGGSMIGGVILGYFSPLVNFFGLPLSIAIGVIIFLSIYILWKKVFGKQERRKMQNQLEEIYDKKFSNELIILDGKKFIECSFTRCILKFEGRQIFETDNCSMDNNSSFTCSDEKIALWSHMVLNHYINLSNDGHSVVFESKDKNGRILSSNKSNKKHDNT